MGPFSFLLWDYIPNKTILGHVWDFTKMTCFLHQIVTKERYPVKN